MNLDPNENEYIGRLKDLMEDYYISFGGKNLYKEFVKDLKLNFEEKTILKTHFFHPLDLDLSRLNEPSKGHLENLLHKYCRLELEGEVEVRRQTKGLY